MHKSWGNAIEFDEAAERMGVDVMRWMFAQARPEDNILFGWHAADEARRELLVLWNVYAFFVTYARLAGWTPSGGRRGRRRRRPADRRTARSTAGSCRAPPASRPTSGERLADYRRASARPARSRPFIDDLSTWYLRRSREAVLAQRRRRRSRRGLRDAPRARSSPSARSWRRSCRSWPRRCTATSSRDRAEAPDSVHLTRWPADELAPLRDEALEARDGDGPPRRRAGPDAARRGRHPGPPAARAGCGWRCPAGSCPSGRRCSSCSPTR